jgi:catechol 2,3-dioxygenase-like lactoylglutathione lyase family enzyme
MHNHVTGLDSVAIAVRDLGAAADTFRRLGFALTPRGHHAEWGTANHCLMFPQDYIQLLAAEGSGDEAERVRGVTAHREGLMELYFGSHNGAAAAESLRRSGLDIALPRSLSRRMESEAGTATMMFSEVPLPRDATPGIASRLIEHITSDHMRFPDWLAHPNGAIGIASVTAVVEDPSEHAVAWDRIFGPHAATPTDNTVTVHTGRGLVFLTRPDDLTQLHPEAELDETPPAPALVAMALQVADTDRAAALLRANGVEFSRDTEGTIRIPPSEACGVFVEFVGA